MQIPQQFDQLEDKRLLLIVASKQGALFYDAHDKSVEEIDSFILPHSNFFNDGPFYKARSQGGMTRSGPVREVQDQKVVSDFIRELKKHMDKIRSEIYSEVYVSAPSKSKNAVLNALPDQLKRKVSGVIEGNYYRTSPLEIVKKIQSMSRKQKTTVPTDPKAQQILRKAEQAKAVIKDTF